MSVSISEQTGPGWRVGVIVLPLLVAVAIGACEPGAIVVPSGGQAVHVVVSGDTVRLEPATVRAGDVYLVLDQTGTNVVLVQAKAAPEETPGPLTDEQLDRISHGDTFHTSITGGFASGGPHGNVSKLVLAPGRYAFLADSPEAFVARAGGTIPSGSMAILDGACPDPVRRRPTRGEAAGSHTLKARGGAGG